jgi:hypothetical protein
MDYNPVLFLQAFEEAVQDGFYADDSIESYPQLGAPHEITVKQQDKPKQRNDLADFGTVVIQGYESVAFILDVQDAILQGFYIDVQSIATGVTYAPHTVTVCKAVQGVLNVTPVASDTPKAENAPQSATEAPTATKTRKSKSKEV